MAALSAVCKPARRPATDQVEGPQWTRIDALVRDAMAAKQTPGAVVVVGQGEREFCTKSRFGLRAVVPAEEPMTLDTVFDLASLTKVVATTTAVMTLIKGADAFVFNDAVAAHIPGFERYNKGSITIRHLLTHVLGLRPDVELASMDRLRRRDRARER